MSDNILHQKYIFCQLTELGECTGGQSGPVSLKEVQSLPLADRCVLTMQMLDLNLEL